jgi:tRNA A-37 threonylcarbamoyl transferase component Bud32
MSDTSKLNQCPKCGGPIPVEAPQGLCPKCLLAQASIPTETVDAVPRPKPPPLTDLAAAFPQLEIVELIGQGGMGFVYKARQPKLERFVALKILPQSSVTDPRFADRFTREGRLLARLNHPNIVTIHDFGQANGFFYLLMEYVDGVNLRQAMRAGRFTPEQALAVVPKICDALQFAHNEGILHRDIKPENILLDSKGRLKIADFGIAKLIGEPQGEAHLTASGGTLGTPHYMAPEQVEEPGAVDHRADIYSLGVVFYEMLTGELPLGKFQPPSQKVQVDVRLDDVVLHALEKEPSRRYQQASEVKTAVDSISATPNVAASSPPLAPPPWLKLGLALKVGLAGFLLTALASMLFTLHFAGSHPGGWIILAIIAGMVVGGVMAIFGGLFSAWRSLGSRSMSVPKPDLFWRRFAVGMAAFILALVLIPMAFILLAMLVPAYMKARDARGQAMRAEQTARDVAMLERHEVEVVGTVTDLDTGQPIPDARVVDKLFRQHLTGEILQETTSDSAGRFELRTRVTEPHLLVVSASGYETNSSGLVPEAITNRPEQFMEIQLQPAAGSQRVAELKQMKNNLRKLQLQGLKDSHPLIITLREQIAHLESASARPEPGPRSVASQLQNRDLRSIQLQEARQALNEARQKYIEPNPVVSGYRKRLDWLEAGKIPIQTNFSIGKTSFPYGDSITIDSVERDGPQMLVKGRYELVSADQANLAFYVTSRTGNGRRDDAREKISISKGSGQFQLYHPVAVLGLPNISMYSSNLTALAEVYFGNEREVAEEKDLVLGKE